VSRLKELRLHGFKTFADPTRFVFERGVNAVIGPNGSGKSNMADAVRWVLGEQSNRSLRTRRADEVIFAGSDARRPQGMAEAVLTLDNHDRWLPVEFAEVTIGRRAYRSGETEYLVNGARARLKDVVELLAGGRLGANQLVVVGQGTVDAALSLRPEERRQLFEEAAGVKNLQVRKNEAMSRLERARDNLARVADLIAELRPQVRRLAVQAQHQQEHDSLGRRARALVNEEHRRRESAARSALGEARRRSAAAAAALEEFRAAQEAGREELAAAERGYWEAEAGARAAAERREVTREALIRAEGRHDLLAARSAELAAVVARAEEELAQLRTALASADENGSQGADAAAAAARAAERSWQAATEALSAADATLLAAEDALSAARLRHAQRIAGEARRGERVARAEARRTQLEAEIHAGAAAMTELQRAADHALAELVAAERSSADSRRRADAAAAAVLELAPGAEEARLQVGTLAERLGLLRSELQALDERAERSGRLAPLLAAAGWRALIDDLQAPPEAWPAIEAVVGGELEQALFWRDGDLLDRLQDADGTVRLLPQAGELDLDDDALRAAALAAVGGTRTLADWVGVDKLPLALRRAAVAPDLASLLAGWRRLPPGWCAVTVAGDLADPRGLLAVRGALEPARAETARRHARRRQVAELVAEMERAHDEALSRAAASAGELAQAIVARTTAGAALAQDERRLVAAQTAAEAAEAALGRARAHAEELSAASQAARVDEEEARHAAPDTSGEVELEALAAAADAARRARGEAAERRDQARDAWRGLHAAAEQTERELGGRQRERIGREARAAQLEVGLPVDRSTLATLQDDLQAASATLTEARDADEAAATDRARADAERDRQRAALLALERGRGTAGARLADLERAAQTSAIEASRLEDALAALARERDIALDALGMVGETDEAVAAADRPPEADADPTLLAEVAALDVDALAGELRRVRRTLAQIGSVNPFAVEEHREMSERLDGLTTQDADLTSAISGTEELIARLDGQITSMFHDAFTAIGVKFDEFCRLLFAGGSAALQLAEGEEGDAPGGIEITVRPPGKRTQRLSMLSGGERALTGVALLFAMLSVNPVPFCILDEVDAALDEANIGRFAAALRVLAEQIDFVVITHNRATIEVADTIYGVTMTDAAVSKVLSLRLADLPAEVVSG
jgi:chromosome segregation protein